MEKTICLSWVFLATTVFLPAAPFAPDDPYFDPFFFDGGTELFQGQWHLLNQAPVDSLNIGLDTNIVGAWNRGWTGSGVTIGIIDDGTEGSHPDLAPGFQNAYSWGFGKDQTTNLSENHRGSPVRPGLVNDGDSHGTSVAGVAAARGGNQVGVTGAAPLANIAALRYLGAEGFGDRSEGEMEAAAILFQGQKDGTDNPNPYVDPTWDSVPVRVKNHSYGPDEGFGLFEGFDRVISALEESASHGVLHVWAAGNQRMSGGNPWSTGDTNKVLASVLPENIIVAALGSDGVFSEYSSHGASVFVTAPSSGVDGFGIVTTDRTGPDDGYNKSPLIPDPALDSPDGYNYTSDFGGTSSASPLVAGIMALGVHANPDMDHRMAKHLMVRTSRIVDPGDSSTTGRWIENGAGNYFNNNYGFGLIDAEAFTEAATRVDTLTGQTEHTTGEVEVNKTFAAEGDDIVETFFVSVDPLDKQPLEYVIVEMTIIDLETDWSTYAGGTGTIPGDLSAWLTSPFGTRNELFIDDRAIPVDDWEERRDYGEDSLEWQFLSNAYWGEDPDGLWVLELFNDTDNPLSGTWVDYTFTAGMGELTLVPEPGAFAVLLSIAILPALARRRAGG